MDKIILQNMTFYGYHGLLEGEKENGQRFEVDLEVGLDLSAIGARDRLESSVDYRKLFALVKNVMEREKYNLLEKAAEEIAQLVLSSFSVEQVIVRIRKPGVLLGGILDYAGVEIVRRKNQ